MQNHQHLTMVDFDLHTLRFSCDFLLFISVNKTGSWSLNYQHPLQCEDKSQNVQLNSQKNLKQEVRAFYLI